MVCADARLRKRLSPPLPSPRLHRGPALSSHPCHHQPPRSKVQESSRAIPRGKGSPQPFRLPHGERRRTLAGGPGIGHGRWPPRNLTLGSSATAAPIRSCSRSACTSGIGPAVLVRFAEAKGRIFPARAASGSASWPAAQREEAGDGVKSHLEELRPATRAGSRSSNAATRGPGLAA